MNLTPEDRLAIEEVRSRHAEEAAAGNGHVTPAPTMVAVLFGHLRTTYDPIHRRDQLIWSRSLGRTVDLREAGQGPETPLLARLLCAADCPQGREGGPSTAGVLRVWRSYLGVAWADLLATLPDEVAAAEMDEASEDELRRHLAALLGRVVTIGRRVAEGRDTDVQTRSLLDCCLSWADPDTWGRIRSYWLWCRLDGAESLPVPTSKDDAAGRKELHAARCQRLRVALRVELAGQVGMRPLSEWPARKLTELCEHYGLGKGVRIGSKRKRAVELAPAFLADLLGDPDSDRDPGEEG